MEGGDNRAWREAGCIVTEGSILQSFIGKLHPQKLNKGQIITPNEICTGIVCCTTNALVMLSPQE